MANSWASYYIVVVFFILSNTMFGRTPKSVVKTDEYKITLCKLENRNFGAISTKDSYWVTKEDSGEISRKFSKLSRNSYVDASSLIIVENFTDSDLDIDNCYSTSWKVIIENKGIKRKQTFLGNSWYTNIKHKIPPKDKMGIVVGFGEEGHLLKGNFPIIVYNSSTSKIKPFMLSFSSYGLHSHSSIKKSNISPLGISISIMRIANFFDYRFSDRVCCPVLTSRNDSDGMIVAGENNRIALACFALLVSNNSGEGIKLKPFYSKNWSIIIRYEDGSLRKIPLCSQIVDRKRREICLENEENICILFGFSDAYLDYDTLREIYVAYDDGTICLQSNILKPTGADIMRVNE